MILLLLSIIISSVRLYDCLKFWYAPFILSSTLITSSGQTQTQRIHVMHNSGSESPVSASKASVGHSVSQSRHMEHTSTIRTGFAHPRSVLFLRSFKAAIARSYPNGVCSWNVLTPSDLNFSTVISTYSLATARSASSGRSGRICYPATLKECRPRNSADSITWNPASSNSFIVWK